MSDQTRKVELYALSTCGWCKKTKEWLDENRVSYDICYMDLAEAEEKQSAKDRISEFTAKMAFPLLIIDNGVEVIQGYKPDRFKEVLVD